MTRAAPIPTPKNKREVKGALSKDCDRRSAHQSLFNIIQSLADFGQPFHVSDDLTAVSSNSISSIFVTSLAP